MNKLSPLQNDPELGTSGAVPHIAVAPGLLGQRQTVIREQGESDERYRARCEMLAALLDFAAKQD